VDFFSHLESRPRILQTSRIHYREAAERCLVLPSPAKRSSAKLFHASRRDLRIRAGGPVQGGDAELEKSFLAAPRRLSTRIWPLHFLRIASRKDGWATL